MRTIDTHKIKNLLSKNDKTQLELSKYLKLSASGLSDSINGKRPLSMKYVFDLASFFDVDAISLTIDNDTKQCTDNTSANETQKA